jgi:hypothetical protein
MSVETNAASLAALRVMGFTTPRDVTSYLHLRGYIQVLGVKSLVACRQPSFCHKEHARSSEIFLNTGTGIFYHLRFDEVNKLLHAGVINDMPAV